MGQITLSIQSYWSVDGTDRFINTKLLVSGQDRSLYQYKVIGQWTGQITLNMTKLLVSGRDTLLYQYKAVGRDRLL